MKLLRNFDAFSEYYDIVGEIFIRFDTRQKTIGYYKVIDDNLTAIFVENKKMYFMYNTNLYEVNDNSYMKVGESNRKKIKKIYFFDENNSVVEFAYKWEESYNEYPEFGMIEKEDFDWGVFLSNIINNKKRKQNFIDNMNKVA